MLLKASMFSLLPPAGQVEKYINSKWQRISAEDHVKMTKLDGQVWMALYSLILKEECQRKYDFNNFNKNQLLKVCAETNAGFLPVSFTPRELCV